MKRVQDFLKPHTKQFLPEVQVRELIHQAGMKTFPRPAGIPENFRVRITEKGGGVEYAHPDHTHITVRVMPGKPHSPMPHQQQPYVIQKMNGKAVDKHGNYLSLDAPEAHIPIEEFVFKEVINGA